MENEDILLTTKLQLICWYMFYQKCHELENMVDIKDDGYNDALKKGMEIPSIVSRNTNFSYDNKRNYLYVVRKLFFESLKDKYYEQYLLYYEKISNKARRRYTFLKKKYKIYILIFISMIIPIILILNIFHNFIIKLNLKNSFFIWLTVIVVLLFLIFGVPSYFFKKIEEKRKSLLIIMEADYEGWFEKFIFPLADVKKEWESIEQKFNNNLSEYIKFKNKTLEELIEIKEELKKEIPLPDKFMNEENIECLLVILFEKYATNIRDAIDFLENEENRSLINKSLEYLNYNMSLFNKDLSKLRFDRSNTENDTSDCIVVNDIEISYYLFNQIKSIDCSTKYLITEQLIENK